MHSLPIVMDRQMKEEVEESGPWLRFPSSISFSLSQPCNLASPLHSLSSSSCPFLALSHHYVLSLSCSALQIGFAQEWGNRERENVR